MAILYLKFMFLRGSVKVVFLSTRERGEHDRIFKIFNFYKSEPFAYNLAIKA